MIQNSCLLHRFDQNCCICKIRFCNFWRSERHGDFVTMVSFCYQKISVDYLSDIKQVSSCIFSILLDCSHMSKRYSAVFISVSKDKYSASFSISETVAELSAILFFYPYCLSDTTWHSVLSKRYSVVSRTTHCSICRTLRYFLQYLDTCKSIFLIWSDTLGSIVEIK